jgi:hypothetical protein
VGFFGAHVQPSIEGLGAFSRNHSKTSVCLDDAPIMTFSGDDGDSDFAAAAEHALLPFAEKRQRVVYQDPEQKDEQLRLMRLLEAQNNTKGKATEVEKDQKQAEGKDDWEVIAVNDVSRGGKEKIGGDQGGDTGVRPMPEKKGPPKPRPRKVVPAAPTIGPRRSGRISNTS